MPGGQQPSGQQPSSGQMPGGQQPGGQPPPSGQMPGGQQPGGQQPPSGQMPGGQQPGEFPGMGPGKEGQFPGKGATEGQFPGTGGKSGEMGIPGEFPGMESGKEGEFPGTGAGKSAFSQFKLEPCPEGQTPSPSKPCLFSPKGELKQEFSFSHEGEKAKSFGRNALDALGKLEGLKGIDQSKKQELIQGTQTLVDELNKKLEQGDTAAIEQLQDQIRQKQQEATQAAPPSQFLKSFDQDLKEFNKFMPQAFGAPSTAGKPGEKGTKGTFPGFGLPFALGTTPSGVTQAPGLAQKGQLPPGQQKGGQQQFQQQQFAAAQSFDFTANSNIASRFAEKAKDACSGAEASEECGNLIAKMNQFNNVDELKFQQGQIKDLSQTEVQNNLNRFQTGLEKLETGFNKLEQFGFKVDDKYKKDIGKFRTVVEDSFKQNEQSDTKGLEKNIKQFGKFSSLTQGFSVFQQDAPPPTVRVNEELERTQAMSVFAQKALGEAKKYGLGKAASALEKNVGNALKLSSALQSGLEINDTSLITPAFDFMQQSQADLEGEMQKIYQEVGKKKYKEELAEKVKDADKAFDSFRELSNQVPKPFRKVWDTMLKGAEKSLQATEKAGKKEGAKEEKWAQSFSAGAQMKQFAEQFDLELPDEAKSFFEEEQADISGIEDKLGEDTKGIEVAKNLIANLPAGAAPHMQKTFAQLDPITLTLVGKVGQEKPEAMQSMVEKVAFMPEKLRVDVLTEHAEVLDEIGKVESEIKLLQEEVEDIDPTVITVLESKLDQVSQEILPPLYAAQVDDLAEALREQLAEVEDPIEAEGYIGNFVQTVDSYLTAADTLKVQEGMMPFTNVNEEHSLFDEAMTLKEEGALNSLKTANGKIDLKRKIQKKEFNAIINKAVGKSVLPTKARGTPKNIDLLANTFKAFNVTDLPKDSKQVVELAQSFGIEGITVANLSAPATVADALEVIGSIEQSAGALAL